MKPYYYVFKPVGHPPSRKHDTLEDAIKESQRLCEMHPNQTFEVLQCVAITSAPKPQVSTFYMDGVRTDKDERYIGFPDGMELPEIPDGYKQAIYRGMGWSSKGRVLFAVFSEVYNAWATPSFSDAIGTNLHYCEFIK
jgi:hypothetical protein